MNRSHEIQDLKNQLGQVLAREAETMPRPQTRRAKIIKLGEFEVHEIQFIDGKFTEDLVTNDLKNRDRGEPAHVGDDFGFNLEVGSRVDVALCEGRWWIVNVLEKGCEGYCIDDPGELDYVFGWFFRGDELSCCPEAGGVTQLITNDAGATYESETFQCNGTGDDRKWIFDGSRLRISGMLEEGNIEYRTDRNVDNCSIEMQIFEPQIFPPDSECGKPSETLCLHPLCGVQGCGNCANTSPAEYRATFSGSPVKKPPSNLNCDMVSPTILRNGQFDPNVTSCQWSGKGNFFARNIQLSVRQTANETFVTVTGGRNNTYHLEPGVEFDCWGTNVFHLEDTPDETFCVGFPATITIEPNTDFALESNCYPLSLYRLTDDTFSPADPSEVVCDQVPYFFSFEVTGLTNGTCTGCDTLNDVFKIFGQGRTKWSKEIVTSCLLVSSGKYIWRLGYEYRPPQNSARVLLDLGDSPDANFKYLARYILDLGTDMFGYNCFGPNVFTLDSNSDDCENWPATITVYPLL